MKKVKNKKLNIKNKSNQKKDSIDDYSDNENKKKREKNHLKKWMIQ